MVVEVEVATEVDVETTPKDCNCDIVEKDVNALGFVVFSNKYVRKVSCFLESTGQAQRRVTRDRRRRAQACWRKGMTLRRTNSALLKEAEEAELVFLFFETLSRLPFPIPRWPVPGVKLGAGVGRDWFKKDRADAREFSTTCRTVLRNMT